jgi:hypothetical protein
MSKVLDVTLPEKGDLEGLREYVEACEGKRGIITLQSRAHKYMEHVRLTDKFWHAIETSHQTMTGIRPKGRKPETLESVAVRFYKKLSTAQLRMHCTYWHIDYNAYNTQEEIIAALAKAQAEATD